MNKFCQSCGMPMKQDPKGGGTELDGGKSPLYCGYCYQSGAFTDTFRTAAEMQDFAKRKLREMGLGPFSAWLFTRGIPYLKRWKR